MMTTLPFAHLIKGNPMLTFSFRFSLVFVLSAFLSSCSSPTENDVIEDLSNSFTPEIVGMEKQYFYFSENYYHTNLTSKTTVREDGKVVFVHEVSLSDSPGRTIPHYNFIQDGFLYATSLEMGENKDHPFTEVKIAKSNPKQGDSWWVLPTLQDSTNNLTTVEVIDQLVTPAGIFNDVVSNKSYDPYFSDTVNVYYVKGIGHVGTIRGTDTMLVNYIKVEDLVYGKKF
jgi:hypothetical protein